MEILVHENFLFLFSDLDLPILLAFSPLYNASWFLIIDITILGILCENGVCCFVIDIFTTNVNTQLCTTLGHDLWFPHSFDIQLFQLSVLISSPARRPGRVTGHWWDTLLTEDSSPHGGISQGQHWPHGGMCRFVLTK